MARSKSEEIAQAVITDEMLVILADLKSLRAYLPKLEMLLNNDDAIDNLEDAVSGSQASLAWVHAFLMRNEAILKNKVLAQASAETKTILELLL